MIATIRMLFHNYAITWLNGQLEPKLLKTSLFPKLTDELIEQLGIKNGIEASMSSFLLEADGKKALFDTGHNRTISTGITDRLKELRVSPDEIDYIFITHFHRDHIGGLVDEKDEVYYKNAKIYVSKEEYDGWINQMPKDKSEFQCKIMKIVEKQIVVFDFNDKLPLGVIPLKSFGHTPGHTVYKKDDILFVGDLIHGQDVQIKYPEICPTYDIDQEKSIESRKAIINYARENKLIIAGCHLKYSNYSLYRNFYDNK